MPHRIEIASLKKDARAAMLKARLHQDGILVDQIGVSDVYTIEMQTRGETHQGETHGDASLRKIAGALCNPVLQHYKIDQPLAPESFTFALEIGFLPGVTDNVGNTARQLIEDLLKIKFSAEEGVFSSQVYYLTGTLTRDDAQTVAKIKANELIHRIVIKDFTTFQKEGGMRTPVPQVHLSEVQTLRVDLNLSPEELSLLGKQGISDSHGRRGPLALDLPALETIRAYFAGEGRNPTDVELESLAQTWSEHCKHTIFASPIDDLKEGLYKGLIKRATEEIRQEKGGNDFCVSVFSDNAGGIVFDDHWVVTDKVETHNSPSALDPFGGAVTGIVGVNRDTMGFGMGAKPVVNRYGFCFGDPRKANDLYRGKSKSHPALHPRRLMEGVIEGVNVGGNCSGIPTTQGFLYFDDRYRGKPLVFVGTVGLIPRQIKDKPGWEKAARPGDKIVMAGGRVGQDGIHGATFSSEALNTGSPATAVQIGDPITQKKMSDAILKEARDLGLYTSITDNGAGGLSCSVAEMAKESGGCSVNLDTVPLKYPNLEPWKIWISESQERMTLAVPAENVEPLLKLLAKRGAEGTVIGEFTDSGRCTVLFRGETVMDIDLQFLHNGPPQKRLKTVYHKHRHAEPAFPCPDDLDGALSAMLRRLNMTSTAFVSTQYDHEVQAGSVIKPLQGKGRVNGEATVVRPVLTSERAVVLSQALYPRYSDIHTYHMAASAIDTAIRNAVAVGGNLDHMALIDNFCWCSSDEPQRLGELKAAAQACYDYATQYGTPFISGKDSMFNDFRGYFGNDQPVTLSVPPTLLISTLSVTEDASKCLTLDLKAAGDLVYVLGTTKNELGGSEYFAMHSFIGNQVPHVDAQRAQVLYRTFYRAVQKELLTAAIAVNLGGIGVALCKMAIAGERGLTIDLRAIPHKGIERDDHLLFSESQGRLIVTVPPKQREVFEVLFGRDAHCIGTVTQEPKVVMTGLHENRVVDIAVHTLAEAYRKTFKNY